MQDGSNPLWEKKRSFFQLKFNLWLSKRQWQRGAKTLFERPRQKLGSGRKVADVSRGGDPSSHFPRNTVSIFQISNVNEIIHKCPMGFSWLWLVKNDLPRDYVATYVRHIWKGLNMSEFTFDFGLLLVVVVVAVASIVTLFSNFVFSSVFATLTDGAEIQIISRCRILAAIF